MIVNNILSIEAAEGMYVEILAAVKANLAQHSIDDKIFFVDVEEATGKSLFTHYLLQFPEVSRQQYNCKTCQRWLNKFGQYVVVEDGVAYSMAFKVQETQSDAVKAFMTEMSRIVGKCPVVGLVVDNVDTYEFQHSGKFDHFGGKIQCEDPRLLFSYTDEERMGKEASAREDVRLVKASLTRWNQPLVEKVAALFEYGELKNSTKFKRSFEQWYKLYKEFSLTKNNNVKNNLVWEAVDAKKQDLIHFSNTVVGNLLDNLNTYSESYALRVFRTETEGTNYMRATEKPTEEQLEKAKALVVEMGIESAFRRRFATVDDIPYWFWKPEAKVEGSEAGSGSIFDGMKTKNSTTAPARVRVEGVHSMTFMAFVNEVLPKVASLKVLFKNSAYQNFNFTQLVAAADPEAKPILRWDSEEKRNTISGYVYQGGSRLGNWTNSPGSTFDVIGITVNPERFENPEMKYGIPVSGVTLILDGLKDRGNRTSALFAETLRHELRDIRRVVEEYSNTHPLEVEPEDTTVAAGLAVSGDNGDITATTGPFRLLAVMKDNTEVEYELTYYY